MWHQQQQIVFFSAFLSLSLSCRHRRLYNIGRKKNSRDRLMNNERR